MRLPRLFAGFNGRGEAAADSMFGNSARNDELQEIVAAASLAADAAHLEAAEGLAVHQGTCDRAVQIEIANKELAAGAIEGGRTAGVDAASEGVVRAVGELERVVQVGCANDGKN